MKHKVIVGIMLTMLLMGILTLTSYIHPAKASTIIVPDHYPTIQQAVDAAINGDTILVKAGTYDEDIVISGKSISLIGEDASNTTIRGLGKAGWCDGVVEVGTSTTVLIKGFTITPLEAGIEAGIYLWYDCNNCTIIDNSLVNFSTAISYDRTWYGIRLDGSNNKICRNNLTSNDYGLIGSMAENNSVYHNNFLDNTYQTYGFGSTNMWDNGYEGNYWSDYNGSDMYQGPYQNETGSDGIGDTPYVINAGNVDHYPLMNPWIPYKPAPVGGVYVPANKLELLAPYVGSTILLAVAVITVAYVKKRKKHTKVIS